MASLPTTLLGDYNAGLSSNTAIQGSNPVLESIAGTDDTDYGYDATNSNHTGIAVFALGDMPADFAHMSTISINLRYAWQTGTQVNTWNTLTAQIYQSDGTTALTQLATVAQNITTTTPTNSGATSLPAPNTTVDKSVWDGALVFIRFNIAKVKSGDTIRKCVFAAEVTGTYVQRHDLLANDVASGIPALAHATVGTIHNLLANNVATGAPTAAQGVLGQEHTLLADDVASGIPVVEQATVRPPSGRREWVTFSGSVIQEEGQEEYVTFGGVGISEDKLAEGPDTVDDLLADNIATGVPTVAQGANLGQVHALLANDIATGAPTAAQGVLGQEHTLLGDDVATAAPTVAQATAHETNLLLADDVATGAPTAAQGSIGQTHVMLADNVATAAPTAAQPAIGQTHAVLADDVATAAPTASQPALGQSNVILADDVATGAPTAAQGALGQTHTLSADDAATAPPTVATGALQQEHVLLGDDVATAAPTATQPALHEANALLADDISSGVPTAATSALGQKHVILADDAASGIPTAALSPLGQKHGLLANNVASGVPTVAKVALTPIIHLRPNADVATGGWTDQNDQNTALYAALNEATPDDDNYIKSSADPADDICTVGITGPGVPVVGPMKIYYRIEKDAADAVELRVRLLENTTEIASWTITDMTEAYVTRSQTLTTEQFAAISNFSNLRVEAKANVTV